MTETLFEAALMAYRRNCPDVAERVVDLLVDWTFKGGRHGSGWAILERGVCGLGVLVEIGGRDESMPDLKAKISKRLGKAPLDQEHLDHAAMEVRGRAETLYREGHWGSAIDTALGRSEHARLRPLLHELADLISPATAGRAAEHHWL